MAISENLSTGEATGAHLTGALGQGVLEFINIVSILYYTFVEFIILSSTFLVNSFV